MGWSKRTVVRLSEEDLETLVPLDQEELMPVPAVSEPVKPLYREEDQLTFEGSFFVEDGIRELVTYIGLCLRVPSEMPVLEGPSWGNIMHKRNEIHRALDPLLPNILRMCAFITASNYVTDALLPDVCGACFTSFGFCISGHVRAHCHKCMYTEAGTEGIRRYWNRQRILQMIGNNRFLMTHIESQLLYKYYSPNGDPLWALILPTLNSLHN